MNTVQPPTTRAFSYRPQSLMMAALVSLMIAALLAIFFRSPLRQRVEDKLFDLRTRVSPLRLAEPLPLVVHIDQNSLDQLKVADLSYAMTMEVIRTLLASGASAVTVLLHPQVYAMDDEGLFALADMARQDPRIYLALCDVGTETGDGPALPKLARHAATQVVNAGIKRPFRRSIVRSLHLRGAKSEELPHAASLVATQLTEAGLARPEAATLPQPGPAIEPAHILLNYPRLTSLPHLSLGQVWQASAVAQVKGRPVLIGYSAYRPARDNQFDATLINSPWQEEGQDVEHGVPLVDVIALGAVNLAHGNWLRQAPLLPQLLQLILVTSLTLGAWQLSAGVASFLFVLLWAFVILLHALLFAWTSYYIPLADTALLATVAMITGALLRLRTDGRLRAAQEAKTQRDATVATIQERFLDAFASEMGRINRSIRDALGKHSEVHPTDGTFANALERARQSSEELEDYLQGIESFAKFRTRGRSRPSLVPVLLLPLTQQTLRQFESRQKDTPILVSVNISPELSALGETTLITQILYNLISNALKYSPPGSTVEIQAESHGGRTLLQVKDQGPGIAEAYQKLIFEKFYRIQNDLSYKVKGHGLGLYLSQYFAALVDGHITVASVPGQGAVFTLSLKSPPTPKG